MGGAFVFGSELKALRAYPGFDNAVCREALAQYMRFMYVPAPRSIYQGVFKLEPGCLLTIRGKPPAAAPAQPLRPGADYETLSVRRWWSLAEVVQAGAQSQITDEAEALQALEGRLSEAVKLQSLADVPLGAFLSGGVDSSAIVALMQQQGTQPVKTFTIGFEEAAFDESPHARAVAQHLGTDHTELFVTAAEAQAVIPQLPAMYDEPFADSSQIPTHLVCKAARQHVTVALSGDAGDELFGGYNRYFWGPRIWNRLAWMPYAVRQALGAAISGVPVGGVGCPGRAAERRAAGHAGHCPRGRQGAQAGGAPAQCAQHGRALLEPGVGMAGPGGGGQRGGARRTPTLAIHAPAHLSPVERMMYFDSLTYLPDDILCKVDRAAMAVSLETRVPFLDHRVAELAWRLPLHMKIRGGEGKWALRQVLYKYVPRELIERPKAGFGIPVGEWLRGPLRDWAESLLDESRLQAEGYFHPAPIRQRWAEHVSGQRDHTAQPVGGADVSGVVAGAGRAGKSSAGGCRLLTYWLMFLVPAWAAVAAPSKPREPGQSLEVAWLVAGVALALLIGFRHEVGGDWFTYHRTLRFHGGAPLQEALEMGDPGYYLLMWLAAQVNGGVYLVNLVSGVLFSLGLVAFCRIQPRPWLALSVAMPYMVIVVGMGYSRQGVALGLAMLGLVGLARKSNLQFVLCVALAATFHKSAVLLVPLAVLSTPHGKLWTGLWVGITAAVLYYVLLADSVDKLVTNYIEAEYQSEGAAVRLAMNAVPAAALLLWRKRFVLTVQDRNLWTMLSLMALAALVVLALSPSSTAVDRVALYMIPLQLFVFSRLPDVLGRAESVRPWVIAIVAYYALVLFVWLFLPRTRNIGCRTGFTCFRINGVRRQLFDHFWPFPGVEWSLFAMNTASGVIWGQIPINSRGHAWRQRSIDFC